MRHKLWIGSFILMVSCGGGGGSQKGIIIREKVPEEIKQIYVGHVSDTFGKAVAFRRKDPKSPTEELVIVYFGHVIRHEEAGEKMSPSELDTVFENHIEDTVCQFTRSSSSEATSLDTLKEQLSVKGYVPGIPGCKISQGPFTFFCHEWSYFLVTESAEKIGRALVNPLNSPPRNVNVSLRVLADSTVPKSLHQRVLMPCRGARFPMRNENMSFILLEANDLHGLCASRRSKQSSPPFNDFLEPNQEIVNLLEGTPESEKTLKDEKLGYEPERLDNETRDALRKEPFTLKAFLRRNSVWATEPFFIQFFTNRGVLFSTSAFSQFTPKKAEDIPLDISKLNFPKLHLFHPRAKNFFRDNIWDPKYDRLLIDPNVREEKVHPQEWMEQLKQGATGPDPLTLCEELYLKTRFINLDERSLPPAQQLDEPK